MSGVSVRAVGAVATIWNLVGVASYLNHVGLLGEAPTPVGPAMPAAVTGAFAIGVFAGVAGSVGLALLKRWARPLLWLSLVTTAIDWAWVLGVGRGGSVPLGVTVLVIATALAVIAQRASILDGPSMRA